MHTFLPSFLATKMMCMKVLAGALKSINNDKKRSRCQVLIRLCSRVIIQFPTVMVKHGYIGELEIISVHRAGKIVVNVIGRLDKCRGTSPRFEEQSKDLEKWQNNLFPLHQCGLIVLITPAGIMKCAEARQKNHRRENPEILFLGL